MIVTTITINTAAARFADRPLRPFPALIVERDDGRFRS
jgi:hypothetical protein